MVGLYGPVLDDLEMVCGEAVFLSLVVDVTEDDLPGVIHRPEQAVVDLALFKEIAGFIRDVFRFDGSLYAFHYFPFLSVDGGERKQQSFMGIAPVNAGRSGESALLQGRCC